VCRQREQVRLSFPLPAAPRSPGPRSGKESTDLPESLAEAVFELCALATNPRRGHAILSGARPDPTSEPLRRALRPPHRSLSGSRGFGPTSIRPLDAYPRPPFASGGGRSRPAIRTEERAARGSGIGLADTGGEPATAATAGAQHPAAAITRAPSRYELWHHLPDAHLDEPRISRCPAVTSHAGSPAGRAAGATTRPRHPDRTSLLPFATPPSQNARIVPDCDVRGGESLIA